MRAIKDLFDILPDFKLTSAAVVVHTEAIIETKAIPLQQRLVKVHHLSMGFIVTIVDEVLCLGILVHQYGVQVAGSYPFFWNLHGVAHQFLGLTSIQPSWTGLQSLFSTFLIVLSLLVIVADLILHCCNHLCSWIQGKDYFS